MSCLWRIVYDTNTYNIRLTSGDKTIHHNQHTTRTPLYYDIHNQYRNQCIHWTMTCTIRMQTSFPTVCTTGAQISVPTVLWYTHYQGTNLFPFCTIACTIRTQSSVPTVLWHAHSTYICFPPLAVSLIWQMQSANRSCFHCTVACTMCTQTIIL